MTDWKMYLVERLPGLLESVQEADVLSQEQEHVSSFWHL